MTKFNPTNKPENKLTYGDTLGPAMKITDPEDAKQYLKAYIEYIVRNFPKDEKIKILEFAHSNNGNINVNRMIEAKAEAIAKSNLGYWAGYGDNKLRERVENLFNCSHPIFGSIAENGIPTAKEAFEMGLNLGKSK